MEAAAQSLRDGFLKQSQAMADQLVALAAQVDSLQVEAEAWKAHNRDLTAKNKLLTAENAAFGQTTLVPVLIDGDGALFDEALLKKGREGGKMAALKLRQTAIEQAAMRLGKHDVTVLAHVFTNKLGLANTFEEHRIVDSKTFDLFCLGFNQASPLFNLTDVGSGKEAADAKIKDTLRMLASLPQTGLVLLGGAAHDAGYTPMLTALKTDGLVNKVVLLKSYSDMAFEIYKLDIPACEPEGLFIKRKLVNQPWSQPIKSSFLKPKPHNSSVEATAAQPSPATNDEHTLKVMGSKYRSVPCWRHHLLGKCAFKEKCTFSHEPITEQQKQQLRVKYADQVSKVSSAASAAAAAALPGVPTAITAPDATTDTNLTTVPKSTTPLSRSDSDSPSPAASLAALPKVDKADFDPLLNAVKQISHSTPPNAPLPAAALKSQVGANADLIKAWKHKGFESFKAYTLAAEHLGLVKSWRPGGPGSDLIGVVVGHMALKDPSNTNMSDFDEAEDEVVMEFE